MEEREGEVLDLRNLWRMARRRWWVLLLVPWLSACTAFVGSALVTPLYEAEAKVLVQGGSIPSLLPFSDVQASINVAPVFGTLIKTRPVMERAVQEAGALYGPEELADKVTVRTERNILRIRVKDPDPGMAASLANIVARSFISFYQEQQLAQLAQFQKALAERGLTDDPRVITAQAAALTSLVLMEPALPPSAPAYPRTGRNVLLALALGLLVAGGLVLLLEYLGETFYEPEDLKGIPGLVPLGGVLYVPNRGGVQLLWDQRQDPDHILRTCYEIIGANLEFSLGGKGGSRSLLVTSPLPGEGKSSILVNLGSVMAQQGKRVVLVDLDLRRCSLTRLLQGEDRRGPASPRAAEPPAAEGALFFSDEEVKARPRPEDRGQGDGVTAVLEGTAEAAEALVRTPQERLEVLPAGHASPNPLPLLRSPRLGEALEAVKARADVVLLDSLPVLGAADALLLVPHVDGVVLVVEAGRTRRREVRRAVEALQQAGAPFIGAVLNKIRTRGAGYYYYYYYQHRDAGTPSDRLKRRLRRPGRRLADLARRWRWRRPL